MPRARHIEVRGKQFPYVLKTGRGRYRGSSAASIRLVVQIGDRKFVTARFLSRAWDPNLHPDGLATHKASFVPSDVKLVIEALLDHEGKLPTDFELPAWTTCSKNEAGLAEVGL